MFARGVLVCVAIAGCGRIAFEPLGAEGGVPGDASAIDARRACAQWDTWSAAIPIPEFAGQPPELDPSFGTIDELWIAVSVPGYDLIAYQRDGAGAYGNPVAAPFNAAGRDSEPAVTGDGLTVLFLSDRDGALRVYETRRAAVGQPFDTPVIALGMETVDLDSHDVSADGLTLYFESGGVLMTATRASLSSAFGSSTELGFTGLWPSISSDQLEIYFQGSTRAYVRSRSSLAETFSNEVELVSLSPAFNGDLEITPDGTELWMDDFNNGLYLMSRECLDAS